MKKISEISQKIIKEFEIGMSIPYLYGIRFWLPKNSNSEEIAKYICNNFPYQAHARSLEELTVVIKKNFEVQEILREISSEELAEILIKAAYQMTEQELPHLRSIQFWLPVQTLLISSIQQSKQIVEYINQNYSDYHAHTEKSIKIPQIDQLPSLVVESKKIIK